jgi:predicted acylesterase/phospholipase RssA
VNAEQAETRLSLGAVNVRSGNLVYFDSPTQVIKPEHVMASGALPPAFPAIEIEGEHYRDGGLVSNTPLLWIAMTQQRPPNSLVFQVDLWSARGEFPCGLAEVATRVTESVDQHAANIDQLHGEIPKLGRNRLRNPLADYIIHEDQKIAHEEQTPGKRC